MVDRLKGIFGDEAAFEERLRRLTSSASSQLSIRLRSGFTIINAECTVKLLYGPEGRTVEDALLKYLERNGKEHDEVFVYCIAIHHGLTEYAAKTEPVARMAYNKAPNEYDLVFGDCIPSSFKSRARKESQIALYDNDENPHCVADLDIYLERLSQRAKESVQGVATGIARLDNATKGLHGVSFVAGVPGQGKSTFCLQIALAWLRSSTNSGVLYYSADMPKSTIYDRVLCNLLDIEYEQLLSTDESASVREKLQTGGYLGELSRLRVLERWPVREDGNKCDICEGLIQEHNKLVRSAKANFLLVIIDYFQLLGVPASVTPTEADQYRLRELLKYQAWTRAQWNPLGVTILAISEVRKGETGRTELAVADLMGSSRLGYSAETVLLLEPGKSNGNQARVDVNIAKCRDGGRRVRVPLVFDFARYRFSEFKAEPRTKGSRAKNTPAVDPLGGLQDE